MGGVRLVEPPAARGIKLVRVTGYGTVTHLTLDGVNPICNATHRHETEEVKGYGRVVTCQGCRDTSRAMLRRLHRLLQESDRGNV